MLRRTSWGVICFFSVITIYAVISFMGCPSQQEKDSAGKVLPPTPLVQWEHDTWGRLTCDVCRQPIDPNNPKDGMYPDRRILCAKCGKRYIRSKEK